jgi:hypothetical protein
MGMALRATAQCAIAAARQHPASLAPHTRDRAAARGRASTPHGCAAAPAAAACAWLRPQRKEDACTPAHGRARLHAHNQGRRRAGLPRRAQERQPTSCMPDFHGSRAASDRARGVGLQGARGPGGRAGRARARVQRGGRAGAAQLRGAAAHARRRLPQGAAPVHRSLPLLEQARALAHMRALEVAES